MTNPVFWACLGGLGASMCALGWYLDWRAERAEEKRRLAARFHQIWRDL